MFENNTFNISEIQEYLKENTDFTMSDDEVRALLQMSPYMTIKGVYGCVQIDLKDNNVFHFQPNINN